MATLHRKIGEGLAQVTVYTDATYDYVCEGPADAALTASTWRVRRVKLDGTRVEWAQGKDDYQFPATDLSTVQALFS